jgi:hypothetical protein
MLEATTSNEEPASEMRSLLATHKHQPAGLTSVSRELRRRRAAERTPSHRTYCERLERNTPHCTDAPATGASTSSAAAPEMDEQEASDKALDGPPLWPGNALAQRSGCASELARQRPSWDRREFSYLRPEQQSGGLYPLAEIDRPS